MKIRKNTLLLTVLVLLAACGGDSLDRRYLDTSLGQPLELPPDLSEFESDSSFDLPQAFGSDGQTDGSKVPVLATVDSMQLHSSADLHWLSVDGKVEDLYQHVKNFWAFEGYGLVVDEPIIGIMETEWIYTEEGGDHESDSWWANLFNPKDLSATQDQFRTRFERDGSGLGSNIYIAHRGTEYVHEFQVGDNEGDDDAEDSEWQYRQSDPELEVEMLSRMMVFLGLQQAEVDAQIERASLYKPRASLQVDAEEKSPYLIIKDPYHIAWNRVYHVLEQMNFEIDIAVFKEGFSEEGVISVKGKVVESEPEGGFFSFGSSEEVKMRDFVLVLSEETHELTRVVVEDSKGQFDTTPEGAKFIRLLYEQMK